MTGKLFTPAIILTTVITLLFAGNAFAASGTLDAAGDGNWTTGGTNGDDNWDGASYPGFAASETATFNGTQTNIAVSAAPANAVTIVVNGGNAIIDLSDGVTFLVTGLTFTTNHTIQFRNTAGGGATVRLNSLSGGTGSLTIDATVSVEVRPTTNLQEIDFDNITLTNNGTLKFLSGTIAAGQKYLIDVGGNDLKVVEFNHASRTTEITDNWSNTGNLTIATNSTVNFLGNLDLTNTATFTNNGTINMESGGAQSLTTSGENMGSGTGVLNVGASTVLTVTDAFTAANTGSVTIGNATGGGSVVFQAAATLSNVQVFTVEGGSSATFENTATFASDVNVALNTDAVLGDSTVTFESTLTLTTTGSFANDGEIVFDSAGGNFTATFATTGVTLDEFTVTGGANIVTFAGGPLLAAGAASTPLTVDASSTLQFTFVDTTAAIDAVFTNYTVANSGTIDFDTTANPGDALDITAPSATLGNVTISTGAATTVEFANAAIVAALTIDGASNVVFTSLQTTGTFTKTGADAGDVVIGSTWNCDGAVTFTNANSDLTVTTSATIGSSTAPITVTFSGAGNITIPAVTFDGTQATTLTLDAVDDLSSTVAVSNGADCTITNAYTTQGAVTVGGGTSGVLELDGAFVMNHTVNVAAGADFDVDGTPTDSAVTLTIAATGEAFFSATALDFDALTLANSGTIHFDGSAGQTVTVAAAGLAFNSTNINNTSGVIITGGSFNAATGASTLTITSTSTLTLDYGSGAGTDAVFTNYTVSNTSGTIIFDADGASIGVTTGTNLTGAISVIGGANTVTFDLLNNISSLSIAASTTAAITGAFSTASLNLVSGTLQTNGSASVTGACSVSATTAAATLDANNGLTVGGALTVGNAAAAGAAVITVDGALLDANGSVTIIVNGAQNAGITVGAVAADIEGSVTVTDGAAGTSTFVVGGATNIAGTTVSIAAIDTVTLTGTTTFDGAATQTVTAATKLTGAVTVSNTAGVVAFTGATTIGGAFTVSNTATAAATFDNTTDLAGAVVIGGATGGTVDFNANSITYDIASGAAAFTVGSAATLTCAGNLDLSAVTATTQDGTMIFDGGAAQVITLGAGSPDIDNISITNTAATVRITGDACVPTASSTLTLAASTNLEFDATADTPDVDFSNYTVTNNGTIHFDSGAGVLDISGGANVTGTITVEGGANKVLANALTGIATLTGIASGGELEVTGAFASTGALSLTAGTLDVDGGATVGAAMTLNSSGGAIVVDIDGGVLTVSAGGLTVTGGAGGTVSLDVDGGNVTITGDTTVTSTSNNITIGTFDSAADFNGDLVLNETANQIVFGVTGATTVSGDTVTMNTVADADITMTGGITFDGAVTQTVTVGTTSLSDNVTVSNTAGTVAFTGTTTLGGTFTVSNTATAAATFSAATTFTGAVVIGGATGGTVDFTANSVNIVLGAAAFTVGSASTLTCAGNFNLSAATGTTQDGTLIFDGGAVQTITLGANSADIDNISVTNTTAAVTITGDALAANATSTLNVAASATLAFTHAADAADADLSNYSTVTNSGTIRFGDTTNIGNIIHVVAPTGVSLGNVTCQPGSDGSTSIAFITNVPTVTNLTVSGGGSDNVTCTPNMNVTGNISQTAGTGALTITGALNADGTITHTNNGNFSAGDGSDFSGTSIDFTGSATVSVGNVTFSTNGTCTVKLDTDDDFSGTITVDGGGSATTVDIDTTGTVDDIVLADALNVTANDTLTIDGNLDGSAAATTVAGTLNIGGNLDVDAGGITNTGTVSFIGAVTHTFTTEAGDMGTGLFQIAAASTGTVNVANAWNSANNGTDITVPSGTTWVFQHNVDFSTTGTVTVAGTVSFAGNAAGTTLDIADATYALTGTVNFDSTNTGGAVTVTPPAGSLGTVTITCVTQTLSFTGTTTAGALTVTTSNVLLTFNALATTGAFSKTAGTGNMTITTTWNADGNITHTTATNLTATADGHAFSGTTITFAGSATVDIGNVTFDGTTTGVTLDEADDFTGTITVNDAAVVTITAATVTLADEGTGANDLIVGGGASGSLTIAGNLDAATNNAEIIVNTGATLTVTGNLTLGTGTYSNANPLVFNGGGTSTVTASTTSSLGDVSISNNTTVNFITNNVEVDNFTVASGSTANVGALNITVNGDMDVDGTFTITGTTTFDGATTQTITGSATVTFGGAFTVQNGSDVEVGASTTIVITGTLQVTGAGSSFGADQDGAGGAVTGVTITLNGNVDIDVAAGFVFGEATYNFASTTIDFSAADGSTVMPGTANNVATVINFTEAGATAINFSAGGSAFWVDDCVAQTAVTQDGRMILMGNMNLQDSTQANAWTVSAANDAMDVGSATRAVTVTITVDDANATFGNFDIIEHTTAGSNNSISFANNDADTDTNTSGTFTFMGTFTVRGDDTDAGAGDDDNASTVTFTNCTVVFSLLVTVESGANDDSGGTFTVVGASLTVSVFTFTVGITTGGTGTTAANAATLNIDPTTITMGNGSTLTVDSGDIAIFDDTTFTSAGGDDYTVTMAADATSVDITDCTFTAGAAAGLTITIGGEDVAITGTTFSNYTAAGVQVADGTLFDDFGTNEFETGVAGGSHITFLGDASGLAGARANFDACTFDDSTASGDFGTIAAGTEFIVDALEADDVRVTFRTTAGGNFGNDGTSDLTVTNAETDDADGTDDLGGGGDDDILWSETLDTLSIDVDGDSPTDLDAATADATSTLQTGFLFTLTAVGDNDSIIDEITIEIDESDLEDGGIETGTVGDVVLFNDADADGIYDDGEEVLEDTGATIGTDDEIVFDLTGLAAGLRTITTGTTETWGLAFMTSTDTDGDIEFTIPANGLTLQGTTALFGDPIDSTVTFTPIFADLEATTVAAVNAEGNLAAEKGDPNIVLAINIANDGTFEAEIDEITLQLDANWNDGGTFDPNDAFDSIAAYVDGSAGGASNGDGVYSTATDALVGSEVTGDIAIATGDDDETVDVVITLSTAVVIEIGDDKTLFFVINVTDDGSDFTKARARGLNFALSLQAIGDIGTTNEDDTGTALAAAISGRTLVYPAIPDESSGCALDSDGETAPWAWLVALLGLLAVASVYRRREA